MKSRWLTCLAAVLAFSLLAAGCGVKEPDGGTTDEIRTEEASTEEAKTEETEETEMNGYLTPQWTLEDLQGHWVDVNGDTTLDFKGDQMTFSDPYRKEKFTVYVTETPLKEIRNAAPNEDGFFIMSPLSIVWNDVLKKDTVVLTAGEMVLDARGHSYRFVREEDLEKEKAIQDDSKDLPKTIESEEIKSFDLSFELGQSSFDVPENSEWQRGHYSIEVEKNGDVYTLRFNATGDSYIIWQSSGEVSEEFVRGLARLIKDQKIAEKNGYRMSNNEDVIGWGLYVKYASGEKLELSADGRPALECPFSINAFLEYVKPEIDMEKKYY